MDHLDRESPPLRRSWPRRLKSQPSTIDAACAYANGGYDVILDGILGPWMLESFRAARQKNGLGPPTSSCGQAWMWCSHALPNARDGT
ncbi:hypothetical protein T261_08118 [Streptomyces lydicus]|nr:hypothetical protein T261_08118 [Streptomyces lydicus]